MAEGRFGDRFYVGHKGEGRAQDDGRLPTSMDREAGINMKKKITSLLKQCLGSHSHELCFLAVKFE